MIAIINPMYGTETLTKLITAHSDSCTYTPLKFNWHLFTEEKNITSSEL